MPTLKAMTIEGVIAIAAIGSAAMIAGLPTVSHGQSCVPLQVIGGSGTQVRKSVSVPPTGVTQSNWNTDFTVPSGSRYRRFIGRIVPINGGEYTVQMFLKYNNDTADQVFDQTSQLAEKRPYIVQGSSRVNATPYQVNFLIGGIPVVGDTYTLSVQACP